MTGIANLIHATVLAYFVSAMTFTPVAISAAILTRSTWGWTVTMRTVGWGACVLIAVLLVTP